MNSERRGNCRRSLVSIWRHAMTLTEVMATVAILGVIATIAIARFGSTHDASMPHTCHAQQAEIELQTQLWHRANGDYPAANLSDIGSDLNYFPAGRARVSRRRNKLHNRYNHRARYRARPLNGRISTCVAAAYSTPT